MVVEGKADAFERRYMGKFQALAAEHGIVVRYERDRAARDIGVHLVRKTRGGVEHASGSLVWFQMKGIQNETLSVEEFKELREISVRLKVRDMQLWFRMTGPTYLALFIESADTFLILDIGAYVQERFGRSIFEVDQKTLTVNVPTRSVLDAHAFQLLLRRGTVAEWQKVLEADAQDVRFCERDYTVIWAFATAKARGVEHRMDVTDWQSKLRGEVAIFERAAGAEDQNWDTVREHWQLGFNIDDLEKTYPYLTFDVFDQERQSDIEYWGNEEDEPVVTFSDGTLVYGENCAWEYFLYKLHPELNEMGNRLFQMIAWLIEVDLLERPDTEKADFLDVAPWHFRSV